MSYYVMKAFILAGGEGTRLRPYTYKTPKPMMRIGNKPILQYVIENLARAGIEEFIITSGYKHEQIVDYFGDGSEFGVKIEHAIESEKLNTAGSILPHKSKIDDTFIVAMGDHITNIDIRSMLNKHEENKSPATIALLREQVPLQFGIAEVKDGFVSSFREKPLLTHLYNVAIYAFEPSIFDFIQEKEDFAKDVFPRMMENNEKIGAFIFEDVWYDIGNVEEYERLVKEFESAKLTKDLKL
jgi:mannose-1-phosphate guanylyltransferase